MEIGEPDFTAAPQVVEAAVRALRDGRTAYTATLGLPASGRQSRSTTGIVLVFRFQIQELPLYPVRQEACC